LILWILKNEEKKERWVTSLWWVAYCKLCMVQAPQIMIIYPVGVWPVTDIYAPGWTVNFLSGWAPGYINKNTMQLYHSTPQSVPNPLYLVFAIHVPFEIKGHRKVQQNRHDPKKVLTCISSVWLEMKTMMEKIYMTKLGMMT
jgi:hypothetical protein